MKRTLPFHSPAVWPPLTMVVLFAVIYCVVTGGIWLMHLRIGISTADFYATHPFSPAAEVVLGATAIVYAVYRLCRFHPVCNPAYTAWLRLSPWTAGRPLPLGPVHPVWQDAAVIGVLAALGDGPHRLTPPCPCSRSGRPI